MKYYRPASLDEYFKLRSTLTDPNVTILAGGTDLLPRYERGARLPGHLIDLKGIPALNSISTTEDELSIGALTTIQDLHDHPVIRDEFTALFEAAHEFAGAQIRHRGTIGGNICNASPAGDLLPALYVFQAQLTLRDNQGERQVPIREFILAPGKTILKQNEILVSLALKRTRLRSKFQKVGLRQSMAIAVVNLAYVWKENEQGLESLMIATGAVAPTVVMLEAFTSAYLKSPEKIATMTDLIDEAISPIDDIRATANYRRMVLLNLVKDFLRK